jgi:hypothetical protein
MGLAAGEMPPITVERCVRSALEGATTGSSRPPVTIVARVRVQVNALMASLLFNPAPRSRLRF